MLALTMPSVETMKVRTQCNIEINCTYKKKITRVRKHPTLLLHDWASSVALRNLNELLTEVPAQYPAPHCAVYFYFKIIGLPCFFFLKDVVFCSNISLLPLQKQFCSVSCYYDAFSLISLLASYSQDRIEKLLCHPCIYITRIPQAAPSNSEPIADLHNYKSVFRHLPSPSALNNSAM